MAWFKIFSIQSIIIKKFDFDENIVMSIYFSIKSMLVFFKFINFFLTNYRNNVATLGTNISLLAFDL